MRKILHPLIEENDCLASFDDFELPIKAELLRLYGFYLTFEGRARSKRDFHLLAKDAVTKAITFFEKENLVDKVAESKITLAFCYWNNSEIEEAEALFELLETDFENKLDPVYLQLQINRIMLFWCSDRFTEGIQIMDKIAEIIKLCNDFKLQIMYEIESANLFHHHKKIHKAEFHYTNAIKLCRKFNQGYFLAVVYNNYSLVLSELGRFAEAHEYAAYAKQGFKRINHTGWIPHVIDSQAQIFLGEERFSDALDMVESALEYFSASDDHFGHIGALWTKCRILLKMQKITEAFNFYADLQIIARQHVGRKFSERYSELLSKEIYPLQGNYYEREVPEFKKFLVTRALHAAAGKKTEAARLLGFAKHQNLSEILKKQFPGLYEDLGYAERNPRSDKTLKQTRNSSRSGKKAPREKTNRAVVSKLELGGRMLSFSWNMDKDFVPFYFDANAMRSFNINEAAVVLVTPSDDIYPGNPVVALDGEGFVFGKVRYDSFASIFFLECDGEMIFLTQDNVIGTPVGYQSMAKAKAEIIEFIKI
ncbi:MAG: hypothetical protein LUM44_04600 [Pyrinomonadaceae bacterium]|nr:hypothetical protein [Pyrinomonadaceae bacterium]